jgi:hypothetical protein
MKAGWETKTLGDVCGFQNGFAFKSNLFTETGYHNSIADTVADLGRPEEIGQVFAGFQQYLYRQQIAV